VLFRRWSVCHLLINAQQISSVILLLVGNPATRPLLHDKGAACHCRLTSTKSSLTSASREHNALARLCQCSPTTASCQDHSSSRPRAHTAAECSACVRLACTWLMLICDGNHFSAYHQLIQLSHNHPGCRRPCLCNVSVSHGLLDVLAQGTSARDTFHTQLFARLTELPAGRPRRRWLRRCGAVCLQWSVATSTA
jgi:hypothetical protein